MTFSSESPIHLRTRYIFVIVALAVATLGFAASPLRAQEADVDHLERLKSCQAINDNGERLACFDTAVGTMVTASEAGDVQVVDREDVRQTRRSLFGFRLPDLGIFGGSDDEQDEEERFETTVKSVRYLSRKHIRITTAEDAVWEMRNAPRSLRRIEVGDTMRFKRASLGYFFIRINGRRGVKGRRIS